MTHSRKHGKIILFGDEKLRTVCSRVEVFHKGLRGNVDMISNTLHLHTGGAALAGPQVSIMKQIVVIDYLGKYFELINPQIMDFCGTVTDNEGCLSLPGFWGQVSRYKDISVMYQDRSGEEHLIEVADQMARCFQHEIDHLNGVLYIDRMTDEYVYNDDTNEKIPVRYLLQLTKCT